MSTMDFFKSVLKRQHAKVLKLGDSPTSTLGFQALRMVYQEIKHMELKKP